MSAPITPKRLGSTSPPSRRCIGVLKDESFCVSSNDLTLEVNGQAVAFFRVACFCRLPGLARFSPR